MKFQRCSVGIGFVYNVVMCGNQINLQRLQTD